MKCKNSLFAGLLILVSIVSAVMSGVIVWHMASEEDTLADYAYNLNKDDFDVHYIDLTNYVIYESAEDGSLLRPYAFILVTDAEDIEYLLRYYPQCSSYSFELTEYCYLVTFGAPAISAYYNTAYTLLLDDSPKYAKRWKYDEEILFIDIQANDGKIYSSLDRIWDVYDKVTSKSDGRVYIYKFDRTVNLGTESE